MKKGFKCMSVARILKGVEQCRSKPTSLARVHAPNEALSLGQIDCYCCAETIGEALEDSRG
jgi:hypothetical protein